jgi:hypothetical protein
MRNGNGKRLPADTTNKVVRCAIYKRKSTDEDLQQGFNSLDAQREAAEAGYCTRALGHGIFTQSDNLGRTPRHVLEAATLHFAEASEQTRLIQLHYAKDELIPVEAA